MNPHSYPASKCLWERNERRERRRNAVLCGPGFASGGRTCSPVLWRLLPFIAIGLLALNLVAYAAEPSPGSVTKGGARAGGILWPADGMIVNVKDLGAKGDGVSDDTAALNAAIKQGCGKMSVLYFPAGTYLVSGRLGGHGKSFFWSYLQGAGRDQTIIKLKDNCPGYQDAKNPLWLMSNLEDQPACKCWVDKASGCNMAFDVQLNDFTLDTGKGNPGAIGLHYICNNTGGLKNLTIRSGDGQGVAGIDMRHPWPGPSLIKGVSISGFDYGLWIKHQSYHDTFEDITLENQNVAGILNQQHPISIRRLVSRNQVPAIINDKPEGQVVLIDAELTGGKAGTCAIINRGSLYLRSCTTTGYQAVVEHQGTVLPGTTVDEWFSQEWGSLSPTAKRSLNLPIKDTPELPYDPLDQWESVGKHADKKSGDDWGPAIQAAIDAGKSTVYFPRLDQGGYLIKSQVIVRGAVRVIQGCGAAIKPDGKALAGKAAFRIDQGTPDTVFFEKFTWENGEQNHIEHAARVLVMQQCRWQRIITAAGCGDLFVDCWGGSGTFTVPQKVYARALNMEAGGPPKLINQAADLWVLGLKTEGDATNIRNLAGGRVEVLGGLIYPAGGKLERVPGFINEGGAMSVITTTFWANKTAFQEVVGGRTRAIRDSGRFWSYVFIPDGG